MPLLEEDLRRIVDRLIDDRYENLTSDEQRVICRDEVKNKIYSVISQISNIRKLDKLVEGLISLKLTRALVNGHLTNSVISDMHSLEP